VTVVVEVLVLIALLMVLGLLTSLWVRYARSVGGRVVGTIRLDDESARLMRTLPDRLRATTRPSLQSAHECLRDEPRA
jgi:UPF0716 family protein affecting phage T7 exclusion